VTGQTPVFKQCHEVSRLISARFPRRSIWVRRNSDRNLAITADLLQRRRDAREGGGHVLAGVEGADAGVAFAALAEAFLMKRKLTEK